jgi:hypothetical protein
MEERERELTVAMIVVAAIFVPLAFLVAYHEARNVGDAAFRALGIGMVLGFGWTLMAKDLPAIPARRRRIARALFWVGGLLFLGLTVAIGWSSPIGTQHRSGFWLGGSFLTLLLAADALRMPSRWMGWTLLALFTGSIVWSSHYRSERVDPMIWFFFAWTVVAVIREELKRLCGRQDGPDGATRL